MMGWMVAGPREGVRMTGAPLLCLCLWSHLYEGQGAGPKAPMGARDCAGFRRVLDTEQPVPGEDTSCPGQEWCWSH